MVRGFAGFGAAMMMTPVFSALYGPEIGIALCLLLEIAVALPLLPRAVKYVDWRRIGLLMVAAVVGAPLGNLALTQVSPEPMRWAISAIVLTAVALLASGWRFQGQWRAARHAGGIGVTSGFLNGLSGMAGPPIAFYYLAGNETVTGCGRTSRPTSCSSICGGAAGLRRPRHGALGYRRAGAVPCSCRDCRRPARRDGCFPSPVRPFIAVSPSALLVGVAIGSLIL